MRKITNSDRIKLFTWHIHGSYLYYLSKCAIDIYIPYRAGGTDGYIGKGHTFPFGSNVHEVPVEEVRELTFDCILFQSPKNYFFDQFEILSDQQRALPKIYLEHDPPQETPTDTRHVVDDPAVTLVHVTHFNNLMWDNNRTPSCVIEHGVPCPSAAYTGELERGVVVINNLSKRGRRLGLDIFQKARKYVPLDLIGMEAEELNGLGEILHPQLPDFIKRYRFFFNPIRYTSLGLAVCEAMMIGMPVAGMATTEMVTVIRDGHSGFLDTDPDRLIEKMKLLLQDKDLARRLGEEGKREALQRFNIERFAADWQSLLESLISRTTPGGIVTTDQSILMNIEV